MTLPADPRRPTPPTVFDDAAPSAPTLAAALRYGPTDAAPHIVAKGRGAVADEIVRRAIAAGVPRVESEALANALVRVELDAAIPPELYLAVAEVLAWVYRIDADARRTTNHDATRN